MHLGAGDVEPGWVMMVPSAMDGATVELHMNYCEGITSHSHQWGG